jgi:hypothetical protein
MDSLRKFALVATTLVALLSGCSAQMNADEYERYIGEHLEDYFEATSEVREVYEDVLSEKQPLQALVEPAIEERSVTLALLRDLEGIEPPAIYEEEHSTLISIMQCMEQSADHLIRYARTGDKKRLDVATDLLETAIEYMDKSNMIKRRNGGE